MVGFPTEIIRLFGMRARQSAEALRQLIRQAFKQERFVGSVPLLGFGRAFAIERMGHRP